MNKQKFNFTEKFLLEERSKGKSLEIIAKETGTCYGTVYKYCLKFNIPLRKLIYQGGIFSQKTKKLCPFCRKKEIKLCSKGCNSCINKFRWDNRKYKEKVSKNISISLKNKFLNDSVYIDKINNSRNREDYKNNMREKSFLLWKNNSYILKVREGFKKSLKIRPNKPEVLIKNLLSELNLSEYKYVGNGKIWIDSFNPDFINVNGQKKIIEFFGCYWHNCKICNYNSRRKEKDKERLKSYRKYGYKTLVIWEHELKDLNRIKDRILFFQKEKINGKQ